MKTLVELVAKLILVPDDGTAIRFNRERNVVAIHSPTVWSGFRTLREQMRPDGDGVSVTRLQQLLRATGFELEFRVGDHVVGQLGANSKGTWLSRLLGVAPAELQTRALLKATLRQ